MNEWLISELFRDDVALSLLRFAPSVYYNQVSWPCEVTLNDGSIFSRVIIRRAEKYYHDSNEIIPASRIVEIRESPFRLPSTWSNSIYSEGETGMDYFCYRTHFKDGSTTDFVTPSIVDFPEFSDGKTSEDVLKVETFHQLSQPFDYKDGKSSKYCRCYFRN